MLQCSYGAGLIFASPHIFKGENVKYTIIHSDTGAPFVQQTYDKAEDAEAALVAVKAKVGDRYPLAVAPVDEGGEVKAEAKTTDPAPVNKPRPSQRGPR